MIESKLIEYLEHTLNIPCFVSVPENAPETFCVLERMGGARKRYVYDTAHVMVDVYSTSKKGAYMACELVTDTLYELEDTDFKTLSVTGFSECVPRTAPKGKYRYQSYLQIKTIKKGEPQWLIPRIRRTTRITFLRVNPK